MQSDLCNSDQTAKHIMTSLFVHFSFIVITKKIATLWAAFSSSWGGLQPSAATVGPFGPKNRALREIHLKIFAEIHLENFAEICLIFFAEINLAKVCGNLF